MKNLKFEDALKRLEKIVEQLEATDVDIEKSLQLFEEGIKLVRFCSSKLEEAKKKVEILVKKEDGTVKLRNLLFQTNIYICQFLIAQYCLYLPIHRRLFC